MESHAMRFWKVGELAKETGLTIRTLHHWDEVGLLQPRHRTAAGYRLYGEADVQRLFRIMALRQLGFTLEEVRESVDRPAYSLEGVIELRIGRIREDIARQQELERLLVGTADRLRACDEPTAERLLQLIGRMKMHEKYYTPEQRAKIEQRRREVSDEQIRAAEQEWPTLIAAMREHMTRGTDPGDPAVATLARRWKELVNEFTGGDPGIAAGVMRMYENEPELRQQTGIDSAMFEYVGRAMKSLPAS